MIMSRHCHVSHQIVTADDIGLDGIFGTDTVVTSQQQRAVDNSLSPLTEIRYDYSSIHMIMVLVVMLSQCIAFYDIFVM